uniref:Proline-rich transmembrane protein 3/4 domain-containing protein n=1 Tax=Megaselia scalaris TaxID=36166 RepID=T1H3R1_MEGSC
MRPLTVYVGGGVHVTLCITLHYVESYTTGRFLSSVAPTSSGAAAAPPIKILSLICQLFYIFICLFLGGLYMTLYPRLKRVLAAKNQNYIHEYSSFLYAIHITISTALLFVLMAALQMFGAFTISTARRASIDKDWLQWGYQFSLRLIELAIILLVSWVSGLKVGVSVEHELSTNHRHFKEIEPPSHYSEPMEFSRRVYDVYEIGATAGGPTTESSSSGSFGSRRRNDDVVSNCNAERTRLTVLGTAAQGLAPTPPPPPTTNGSMLVAECGFVRFRNLENMNFVGAGV